MFEEYAKKFAYQEQSSYINYIIYPAYVLYTDFVYLKKIFYEYSDSFKYVSFKNRRNIRCICS